MYTVRNLECDDAGTAQGETKRYIHLDVYTLTCLYIYL